MEREKKKYYRYENESDGSNEFVLKERMLYSGYRNCFLTKEEAKEHFDEAYKIALDKYEKIMEGIRELRNTLGYFSYDYYINGDTYGIYSEGMYLEFEVNGYNFKFLQED